jgi:hypothetical protein
MLGGCDRTKMDAFDGQRYRVAVVRVEIRDQPSQRLLIRLVELSRDSSHDRLLGSASDSAAGCRILLSWLDEIDGEAGKTSQ